MYKVNFEDFVDNIKKKIIIVMVEKKEIYLIFVSKLVDGSIIIVLEIINNVVKIFEIYLN